LSRYKVVILDDLFEEYDIEKKILNDIGADLIESFAREPDDIISDCRKADAIMCNLVPMPEKVIMNLDRCRIISRYGVGYDNIDVKACTLKGIMVANVNGYCIEEVSDHALALMLNCIRRVAQRDRCLRNNLWGTYMQNPIYRMTGRVLALMGFGEIARNLLKKINGFNFSRVIVYDPFVDKEVIESFGAEKVDWETALSQADIISLHMPLNKHTKNIINDEAFALMKNTAILINTARGQLINEESLVKALSSGRIMGAGLDVFDIEPPKKDSLLLKLDNCVLTDHMSWYSMESIQDLKRMAAENVRDALKGKRPRFLVNEMAYNKEENLKVSNTFQFPING
jgi:D-3-phosphoglycerate dehydrogenase